MFARLYVPSYETDNTQEGFSSYTLSWCAIYTHHFQRLSELTFTSESVLLWIETCFQEKNTSFYFRIYSIGNVLFIGLVKLNINDTPNNKWMDSIKQRETRRNCRMVNHGGQIIIAFLMTLLFVTLFTKRMYDYSKTLETPIYLSLPKSCRFWNSNFIYR